MYSIGNEFVDLTQQAEIPDDPELAVDLCAPGYETTRGKRFHGSIQLEHKEDLKARGEGSPDDGDCLAMTFAVKVAAKQKPIPELGLQLRIRECALDGMRPSKYR